MNYNINQSKSPVMTTHKDLKVWKKSMDLVESIYVATKLFPKDELYGLTSQMRRAAVSIPSNIAEGAARKSKKEFLQFLYVALGSISELETQCIISKRLKYIDQTDTMEKIEEICKMLTSLIKYQKSQI